MKQANDIQVNPEHRDLIQAEVYEELSPAEQCACIWDALNVGDTFTLANGKTYTMAYKAMARITVKDTEGKAYPIWVYGSKYMARTQRRRSSPTVDLFNQIEATIILDLVNANNSFHKPSGLIELGRQGFIKRKQYLLSRIDKE